MTYRKSEVERWSLARDALEKPPRRRPPPDPARGTRYRPGPPQNSRKWPSCPSCGSRMTHLFWNRSRNTDYYACERCFP